ncbi:MAG: type II toxin-antitoxin system HicB family antitoxin [Desulfobacteraceae bacterium]|nr:MAG: type II toxin-antitoxin system HicB family antitoxin [Desulfobacteraceae bacterium]
MFKYSIFVAWSDEDEAYVATIPEFPGLSAFGDTPEKAIREAKTAAKGFIKVYEEDGCDLPEPNTITSYSGQTRLRLPKSLHAALSQEAQIEGISFNTYVINLLSERHAYRKINQELETIKRLLECQKDNVIIETSTQRDLISNYQYFGEPDFVSEPTLAVKVH